MKTINSMCCAAILCCAPWAVAAEAAVETDLRRCAPVEAHLAIYGKHNPERDYQTAYLEEICQTVRDEKIVERFLEIITSRMPDQKLNDAKGLFEELRTALSPADWQMLADCQEIVYAQQMKVPFNHHLIVLRLPSDGAEKMEASLRNLFALMEKKSEGRISVSSGPESGAELTILNLPSGVPMSPAVVRLGDVLIISTSEKIALQSLARLQGESGPSKFDDPRLAEALAQLPEPEDAVVFFDGQQLFTQLHGLGEFIRQESRRQGEENENEKAERVAGLVELLIDELAVNDYEVTVEYTEGNQNRSAVLGKLSAGAEDKLLGIMLVGGEPFDQWQNWIPADAIAYSLSSGVRLHPFYERLTELLREKLPETHAGFAKFEQVQEQFGVHLDRDILQSFSGECVSITLPSSDAAKPNGHESVTALRCSNPERIGELLHRLVDGLNTIPAVQAQQLGLESCDDLPHFERLNALVFAMFNVKPVIGFHDGWMVLGSSEAAVEHVLDARDNRVETIDASEDFQRFDLEIDGPVRSLSYADLAENTRHAAQAVRQVGMIAPAIIGMVGAKGNPEDLKPVQELLGLLPSLANVVEKFDFLEARLTVEQPGDSPDTYVRHSVTLVRPPAETSTR